MLICTPLAAQNYDNPGLGEMPVSAHPQDFKPLGIRAGGFMLHPGGQLAGQYTDNVFFTNEEGDREARSDTIFHIRPYITAQSTWSRHSLNVRLSADIARHSDYGFRDYEDYFFLVNGRVDVRNRSYLTYSLDYMNLHEGLNTRSAEQGLEPTRYDLYGGSLGYDHMFNRLSVGILGAWRRLDFDNALGLDGTEIDNQDRDRDEVSLRLRAGYTFRTDMQAFATYSVSQSEYKEAVDRNGKRRDSEGWSATAGILFQMTGKLNGDLSAGYHHSAVDDPSLPDVEGWGLGAGLAWTPTYLTSVGLRVSTSIEPTTIESSSGYFMTLYSARLDHQLLRDLQLSGQVSYRVSDYQLAEDASEGARSKDKTWQAGLGLNYFVNRYVFLSAAYTWEQLTSNVDFDDYTVNTIWLTLSLER
jgi:hypothetical protein